MEDYMDRAGKYEANSGDRLAMVEHLSFSATTFIHATPVVHYKGADNVEHQCVYQPDSQSEAVPQAYSTLQWGIPDVFATNCQSLLQDGDEVWVTATVGSEEENVVGTPRDKNPDGSDVRHFTYKKHSGIFATYVVQGKLDNQKTEYLVAYTTNCQVFEAITRNFVSGNAQAFFDEFRAIINVEQASDNKMYNLVLNNSILHSYAPSASDDLIQSDISYLISPFVQYDQYVKYHKDDISFKDSLDTPTLDSLLSIYFSASKLAAQGTDTATNTATARKAFKALRQIVLSSSYSKLTFNTTNYADSSHFEDIDFQCSPERNPDVIVNSAVLPNQDQAYTVVNCNAIRKVSGIAQNLFLATPDSSNIIIGGQSSADCQNKVTVASENSAKLISPVSFSKTDVNVPFTVCVSKNTATADNLVAINTRNTTRWTEYRFAFNLQVTTPVAAKFKEDVTTLTTNQEAIAKQLVALGDDFIDEHENEKDANGHYISMQVSDILDGYRKTHVLTDEQISYLASVGFVPALSLGRIKLLSTIGGYSANSEMSRDDSALLFEVGYNELHPYTDEDYADSTDDEGGE
jgi:hypothetical protein